MAGSNGAMGIEGPDSSGSSSSTLKLTTWRVTFSGGAFFMISTSNFDVTRLQYPAKGYTGLKLWIRLASPGKLQAEPRPLGSVRIGGGRGSARASDEPVQVSRTSIQRGRQTLPTVAALIGVHAVPLLCRSEEHTSELQSPMYLV